MPERVGNGYRCDLIMPAPVGRVKVVLSAVLGDPKRPKRGTYWYRENILLELREDAQMAVLAAFKDGKISIEELEDEKRNGTLGGARLADAIKLRARLLDHDEKVGGRTVRIEGALTRTLPAMGRRKGKNTQHARYAGLAKQMPTYPRFFPPTMRVMDLEHVDWPAFLAQLPGQLGPKDEQGARVAAPVSAATQNHWRRFIGAFLTKYLGSEHHLTRLAILARIPIADEEEREPDLPPARFRAVVARVPAYLQPAFWTMALTGMRLGEYLRCTAASLKPASFALVVPGRKTKGSKATITIGTDDDEPDPLFWWKVVTAAIPCPVAETTLRKHWKAACQAEGVGKDSWRLHDLRHVTGQTADEAGVSLTRIKQLLRHTNVRTTTKYTTRRDRGEAVKLVGRALRGT